MCDNKIVKYALIKLLNMYKKNRNIDPSQQYINLNEKLLKFKLMYLILDTYTIFTL